MVNERRKKENNNNNNISSNIYDQEQIIIKEILDELVEKICYGIKSIFFNFNLKKNLFR